MRCLALLMVLALGRGARPPRATLPGGRAGWLSRRQAILGAVGGAAALAAPRAAEASFGASRAAVVSPPTVKDTKDLDAEIFRNLDPRKRAQLQSILSTKQTDDLVAELNARRNALNTEIEQQIQRAGQRAMDMKELRQREETASREIKRLQSELSKLDTLSDKAEMRRRGLESAKGKMEGENRRRNDEINRIQLRAQQEAKLTELFGQRDAFLQQLKLQQEESEQAKKEKEARLQREREEVAKDAELQAKLQSRSKFLAKLNAQPDWFNYVAAGGASCVSTLIMHPLDTIKTRQISKQAEEALDDTCIVDEGPGGAGGGGHAGPGPAEPGGGGALAEERLVPGGGAALTAAEERAAPSAEGVVVAEAATRAGLGAAAPAAVVAVAGAEAAASLAVAEEMVGVVEATEGASGGGASGGGGAERPTAQQLQWQQQQAVLTEQMRAAAAEKDYIEAGRLQAELLALQATQPARAAAAAAAVAGPEAGEASEAGAEDGDAWTLEGIKDLYAGLSGALLKEGPPSALYLGVYEAAKAYLLATPQLGPHPLAVYLISGAAGETIGSVVRAPAEAIKARVQSGADASTLEACRKVLLTPEGRENVVRAWSSSLWRDVPFGALQLAIFEGLKAYIISSPGISIDIDSLASEALLGAIGGSISAFLTTPTDVLTIRILTQGTGADADAEDAAACEDGVLLGGDPPPTLGIVGMAKQVWSEGGAVALMSGAKERTLYWAPAIGIFLSCYCSIRQAAVANGLFGA